MAYEQAREVRDACVDLFTELTRRMIDNAADMGNFVVQQRKVTNPVQDIFVIN